MSEKKEQEQDPILLTVVSGDEDVAGGSETAVAGGETPDDKVAESSDSGRDAGKGEQPSLIQLLGSNVSEEDAPLSRNRSLKDIVIGDFLGTDLVRRQIGLVLLIAVFMFISVAERHSYQKYMVEIDKMEDVLVDARFRALSSKSDLTEHTRQSRILDMLKANSDSLMEIADTPPFMIKVPD